MNKMKKKKQKQREKQKRNEREQWRTLEGFLRVKQKREFYLQHRTTCKLLRQKCKTCTYLVLDLATWKEIKLPSLRNSIKKIKKIGLMKIIEENQQELAVI